MRNKKSIRVKIERLKTEFERLSKDKKVSPRVKILSQRLFAMMDSFFLPTFAEENKQEED